MRKRAGILRALISSSAAIASAAALGLCAVPAKAQLRVTLSEDEQASPARGRYEALRAYREGRYQDALAAAATLPNDPDVLLRRGRAA